MEWKIRDITIIAPSLRDPRLFMIGVLTIYTLVGQTLLSFDHSWSQIITSLIIACVLDVAVSYWKTRKLVLPASGVITGLSLGLLVEAVPLWPFIVAPLLAIGSKAVIRFQGKHLFNPSNFGLTVLLLLFPTTVTTLAAQWSGSLLIVMVILVIGGFTTFRVSRWDLVSAFVVSFAVMALVEDMLTHRGLAFVYGPMFGAAFQLFTLSMLTDPKTTPETRLMRVLFGVSIAVIDAFLRLWDFQYSLFVALLIVSACVPLLRVLAPVLSAYAPSSLLNRKTVSSVQE
ncbi:MAG: RnfABCDGE type electron transport complex subunit D [Chloroflexi bacterium]|nr:RnfABCDGE type electron transport complex subunit D [Ktedonobacteraceae bacterium]MBV9021490.1 RnfABCDGE type electron transport complex subunit D [Ktedonobacteraceae bacterium]MBV9705972.1 RnfABCDGE type electron transport complex subunit D [Chloroflexota bacterium]